MHLNLQQLADIWPLFCCHCLNGKCFDPKQHSSIEDNVKTYKRLDRLGHPSCL